MVNILAEPHGAAETAPVVPCLPATALTPCTTGWSGKYGDRCDMLNLYYLSFKHGFVYLDEFLSEFTIRKGQIGIMKNDQYLYDELIFLKKTKYDFYKKYIAAKLHYDFSILILPTFIKNKNYSEISLNWVFRSLKFRIWKFIRFLLPDKFLDFLFNLFK